MRKTLKSSTLALAGSYFSVLLSLCISSLEGSQNRSSSVLPPMGDNLSLYKHPRVPNIEDKKNHTLPFPVCPRLHSSLPICLHQCFGNSKRLPTRAFWPRPLQPGPRDLSTLCAQGNGALAGFLSKSLSQTKDTTSLARVSAVFQEHWNGEKTFGNGTSAKKKKKINGENARALALFSLKKKRKKN